MTSDIGFYHEGDNIYINLSLYNNTLKTIPASIDVNIEKPIVDRADEYKMSIIRFTCPLFNIPRYFLSDGDFRVAFTYGSSPTGPFYGTAILPLNPVQSIYFFVQMINGAIQTAWNALKIAHGNITAPPPYFLYDPITRLFSFVVDKATFDATGPNKVDFYVSFDFYAFIYSFPIDPSTFDPNFMHLIIQKSDLNIYTSPTLGASYRSFQEFPTDHEFNTLQSVIITTTLPVRNEYVPLSTGQSERVINSQGNISNLSYISSIPVLTDFLVPIEKFGDQNQRVFYLPTAEFRWTDFIYSLPLDRLSFTFYYQIADQSIYPLTLPPGSYCSMKILLRRKI